MSCQAASRRSDFELVSNFWLRQVSGIGLDLEDQRLARGSVENPEFNSKVPFHYLSRQIPQLTLSTQEGLTTIYPLTRLSSISSSSEFTDMSSLMEPTEF